MKYLLIFLSSFIVFVANAEPLAKDVNVVNTPEEVVTTPGAAIDVNVYAQEDILIELERQRHERQRAEQERRRAEQERKRVEQENRRAEQQERLRAWQERLREERERERYKQLHGSYPENDPFKELRELDPDIMPNTDPEPGGSIRR